MSLYDGLDIEDKPVSTKADMAGWGSTLKLMETQKQIQEKKMMLQSITKKKNIATPTPVMNILKGRRPEETPSRPSHGLPAKTIETTPMMGGQFMGMIGDIGFNGVVDEYDPYKPNDYEKLTKARKQTSRDHEKSNDEENERKSRREERRSHRSDDHHHDDDHGRGSRPSGWRSHDSPSMDGRKRLRHEDGDDYGNRRRRREDERSSETNSTVQKAAIAPPQSLLESNGPFLNKPEAVGSKFGMGGSVASKIMARMGYKEGQGLGRQEQGMSIALQVEKTSKKIGKIIHEKDLHKSQDMSVPRAELSNANLLRNPSKVIVLRNMVGPGEVDEMLDAEVSEECTKYGKVVKCLIFEMPDCPEEEAVRIFVEFDRLEASIKAVVDLNGRFFGGKVVKGNFYDIEKFKNLDLGTEIE